MDDQNFDSRDYQMYAGGSRYFDETDAPTEVSWGREARSGEPSDPTSTNPMNDWGTWARGVTERVVGAAVDNYQYGPPARRIPAVGPAGQRYAEGQRVPPGVSVNAGSFTLTPQMLMLAAGAAFLIMKK